MAAIQASLMALHAGGRGMPNAVAGGERELFAREFLGKLFAPSFRFGTGAITDALNNISGQVDIVIENTFAPSFPMPAGDHRLYLAESVAVAIEVKSDLLSQWDEVRATIDKIKVLQRDLGQEPDELYPDHRRWFPRSQHGHGAP
jgi:hypothetical protein